MNAISRSISPKPISVARPRVATVAPNNSRERRWTNQYSLASERARSRR